MIVFLLTGIWHGANFTFIIWGLVYGIIQIIEKLFLLKFLNWNKIKPINWIYTFVISVCLFVVFRSDTIYDAMTIFGQYFTVESSYSIFSYMSMKNIIIFIMAIFCMGFAQRLFANVYNKINKYTIINVIDAFLQFVILAYATLSIVDGTYNPFIYFQF